MQPILNTITLHVKVVDMDTKNKLIRGGKLKVVPYGKHILLAVVVIVLLTCPLLYVGVQNGQVNPPCVSLYIPGDNGNEYFLQAGSAIHPPSHSHPISIGVRRITGTLQSTQPFLEFTIPLQRAFRCSTFWP
jgi:hypothetical protein